MTIINETKKGEVCESIVLMFAWLSDRGEEKMVERNDRKRWIIPLCRRYPGRPQHIPPKVADAQRKMMVVMR